MSNNNFKPLIICGYIKISIQNEELSYDRKHESDLSYGPKDYDIENKLQYLHDDPNNLNELMPHTNWARENDLSCTLSV